MTIPGVVSKEFAELSKFFTFLQEHRRFGVQHPFGASRILEWSQILDPRLVILRKQSKHYSGGCRRTTGDDDITCRCISSCFPGPTFCITSRVFGFTSPKESDSNAHNMPQDHLLNFSTQIYFLTSYFWGKSHSKRFLHGAARQILFEI